MMIYQEFPEVQVLYKSKDTQQVDIPPNKERSRRKKEEEEHSSPPRRP
jgi:hypothetical protein